MGRRTDGTHCSSSSEEQVTLEIPASVVCSDAADPSTKAPGEGGGQSKAEGFGCHQGTAGAGEEETEAGIGDFGRAADEGAAKDACSPDGRVWRDAHRKEAEEAQHVVSRPSSARDDVTNAPLDPSMTFDGMLRELEALESLKVGDVVWERGDEKVITTRWVCSATTERVEGRERHIVLCRVVARDFAQGCSAAQLGISSPTSSAEGPVQASCRCAAVGPSFGKEAA